MGVDSPIGQAFCSKTSTLSETSQAPSHGAMWGSELDRCSTVLRAPNLRAAVLTPEYLLVNPSSRLKSTHFKL